MGQYLLVPANKSGRWKYWAIVQPESAIGQLNIKRLARQRMEQGVMTKFFSDPEEAMVWLVKVSLRNSHDIHSPIIMTS